MADPAPSVAVATGSLVVTGTATSFIAAENDLFCARGQAVPIASRQSPTQITLKQPWPVAPLSGEQAFNILSLGEYWRSAISINKRFADLLAKWEVVNPFKFDAAGTLAERDNYNNQPRGFVYVATDQRPIHIYIKLANTNSPTDWSDPIYLGSGGQVDYEQALEQERQARIAADSALSGQASSLRTDLNAITGRVGAAETAVTANAAAIVNEAALRKGRDDEIATNLGTLSDNVGGALATLRNDLTDEGAYRRQVAADLASADTRLTAADVALSTRITNEALVSAQATAAVALNLGTLSDALGAADAALRRDLNDEGAYRRQVASDLATADARLTLAVTNEAALRKGRDDEIAANLSSSVAALGAADALEANLRADGDAYVRADLRTETAPSAPLADRPGDTPLAFTRLIGGGSASNLPPITDAPVITDRGAVLRLVDTDLIASRSYVVIEPGRLYLGRWTIQRRLSPSPDAPVRLLVAWFDRNRAALVGADAVQIVREMPTLAPGDGRQDIALLLSTVAGDNIAAVVPASAVYGVVCIRTLGGAQATDVEVLSLHQVEDGTAYSPDLQALTSRVTAQESIQAGPRLDDIEANLDGAATRQYETLTAARGASIPLTVNRIVTLGLTQASVGGATYLRSSTSGAGAGRFQSADGAWWEITARDAALEQLGAGQGDATADAAAIQAAGRYGPVATVGTPLQPLNIADLASYFDTAFYDDGSRKGALPGLYGKRPIPALARDAGMTHAGDLIAQLHCPVSAQATAYREIIFGDSLTTFSADLAHRSNTLAARMWQELSAQAGGNSFFLKSLGIGGKTLTSLFDTSPNRPQRPLFWPTDDGRRLIDIGRDMNPTRSWFSFGMNDGPGMSITGLRNVLTEVRAWPKPSDIVFMTNLLPRPTINTDAPWWNTIADQEGKHRAAGLVRTFAKYMGIGLVDMNRQFVRAVHGWDPCLISMVRSQTATPVTNGFAGTQPCIDYHAVINIDTSQLPENTGVIAFPTGPGSVDVVYLTRLTGNTYGISCYAGEGSDNWGYSLGNIVTIAPNNGSYIRLHFEKSGNSARLYRDGTAEEEYGANLDDFWRGKIICYGGQFTPKITANPGVIVGAAFDYGVPTPCNPSTRLSEVFGTGAQSLRGGAYNHPGTAIDDEVYGPVLKALQFYAGDPLTRYSPKTITVRGADGGQRRFRLDEVGFTSMDGDLVSTTGRVRAGGGLIFSASNLAPRIGQDNGEITFTTGTTADSAYARIAANGKIIGYSGGASIAGTIDPQYDNLFDLGTASLRYRQIYAGSPTISTSDAREKLDRVGGELVDGRVSPLTPAEIAWGVALGDEVGVYLWREAVASKGDGARIHVGMTVQRAIDLARAHGLDPARYGFICHDTWEAEPACEAEFAEIETGRDDAGQPILAIVQTRPATPGRPAGDRFGFRYDELTLFIAAAERAARKAA